MSPMEPWRNSTPFFGAAAFCTINTDDLNTSEPSYLPLNPVSVTQFNKLTDSDLTKTQPSSSLSTLSTDQKNLTKFEQEN